MFTLNRINTKIDGDHPAFDRFPDDHMTKPYKNSYFR